MSTTRPLLTRPRRINFGWLDAIPRAVPESVLGFVGSIPFLRTALSKLSINSYAYAAALRPRPLTMASGYTSWRSLTDRTFSGRHLPPSTPDWQAGLPTQEEVVALFMRDEFVPSTDTSVLFSMFAQWFTDSFLRTDFFDSDKNTSNHEIDLCQIYGLTETKTHMLRSHVGGRLRSQVIDGQEFPEFLFEQGREPGTIPTFREPFVKEGDPTAARCADRCREALHDEDWLLKVILGDLVRAEADGSDTDGTRLSSVFAVGLEHGNSTIGNTLMNVVFLREHNRVAGLIATAHLDWDDERIFQTTRNVLIVLLLKLVVEEYIKHIAPFELPLEVVEGMADGERWNRSNWIAVEFNLLYRWHSLVPDAIDLASGTIGPAGMRNNNPLVIAEGVGSLVTDCSNATAGKIGLGNTPSFLVTPSAPGQLSVEQRTVKISRESELRSFNEYRHAFGRKPLKSFDQLTSDDALRTQLEELYGGDIDQLEWYVGIFAEEYPSYMMMGDLLTTMVACDAFTQALTNPLLGKNVFKEETFSATGFEVIKTTTSLRQIVARNTPADAPLTCSFRI